MEYFPPLPLLNETAGVTFTAMLHSSSGWFSVFNAGGLMVVKSEGGRTGAFASKPMLRVHSVIFCGTSQETRTTSNQQSRMCSKQHRLDKHIFKIFQIKSR